MGWNNTCEYCMHPRLRLITPPSWPHLYMGFFCSGKTSCGFGERNMPKWREVEFFSLFPLVFLKNLSWTKSCGELWDGVRCDDHRALWWKSDQWVLQRRQQHVIEDHSISSILSWCSIAISFVGLRHASNSFVKKLASKFSWNATNSLAPLSRLRARCHSDRFFCRTTSPWLTVLTMLKLDQTFQNLLVPRQNLGIDAELLCVGLPQLGLVWDAFCLSFSLCSK